MRAELAGRGIGVSAICPGFIKTAIVEKGRFAGANAGAQQKRMSEFFHKRGRPPEAVAMAIVDAVKRNRAVVPVAPEAWVAWYMKRLTPGLSEAMGRMGAKYALKTS